MAQTQAKVEVGGDLRQFAWHILSSAVPMLLLATFCVLHFQYWLDHGQLKGLGFAIQESVLVVLFLIRRRPKTSATSAGAWLAAILGTFGALLLRPNSNDLFGLDGFYAVLGVVGAALSIIATVYLGRSFGLVAANRGVKTTGAYSIVRHPIYASYFISYVAYILASFSIWNAAVLAVVMTFQIRRIFAEETVLMEDPEYRDYAARVNYRLVPGVF